MWNVITSGPKVLLHLHSGPIVDLKISRHPTLRKVTGGCNFSWSGRGSRMSWTEGIKICGMLWNVQDFLLVTKTWLNLGELSLNLSRRPVEAED